jgi:hypothetical protein
MHPQFVRGSGKTIYFANPVTNRLDEIRDGVLVDGDPLPVAQSEIIGLHGTADGTFWLTDSSRLFRRSPGDRAFVDMKVPGVPPLGLAGWPRLLLFPRGEVWLAVADRVLALRGSDWESMPLPESARGGAIYRADMDGEHAWLAVDFPGVRTLLYTTRPVDSPLDCSRESLGDLTGLSTWSL